MNTNTLLHKAVIAMKELINDYTYKLDVRQKPTDFSRKGKIGFVNLILMTLNYCSKSMQIEINNFFELIDNIEDTVTRPGYLEARSKLKPEAFSKLLDQTIEIAARNHTTLETLNGYRVFAIDGSKLTLEDTISLRAQFGVSGGEHGVAAARLSTLTDVLNSGIIMDAQLSKYEIGERALALRHHERLSRLGISEESIIIYDRGYISADMVSDLNSKKIKYIFRIPKGWNKDIDQLNDGTDTILNIDPKGVPLSVRAVKFLLDSGELETLLISPELEQGIFSFYEMKRIYFLRWGIESNYRVLKSELQIENFTGPTDLFIKQDFYATALLLNLTAFAKLESDKIVSERTALKKTSTNKKQI